MLHPFIATITYTGRRSGNTFSQRRGDTVTVWVAAPHAKQWWRNFLGTGAPITITWGQTAHTGHAAASCDHRGRVTVRIMMDPEPAVPET